MDFLNYTSFFGVATIANVMELEIATQDFDSWEKQLDKRHVFYYYLFWVTLPWFSLSVKVLPLEQVNEAVMFMFNRYLVLHDTFYILIDLYIKSGTFGC